MQALDATALTGWIASPFAFFDTVRDPANGGWSYCASFLATDANSTALVLQAYAAAGVTTPHGGLAALRAAAVPACGAWPYSWNGVGQGDPDVGATIGAMPGVAAGAVPDRTGRGERTRCRPCQACA